MKSITVFPRQGLKSPGVKERLHQKETIVQARVGESAYAGYRIDDIWKMVPGERRIQIWSGDRKLAEQRFPLVERGH